MSTTETYQASPDSLRLNPRRSAARLTLAIARRLNQAHEEAQRQWAEYKRNIGDREKLDRYARTLRRCDRLQSAMEGRAA